jgi:hypothetical protein
MLPFLVEPRGMLLSNFDWDALIISNHVVLASVGLVAEFFLFFDCGILSVISPSGVIVVLTRIIKK